jgi:hypothetical protein
MGDTNWVTHYNKSEETYLTSTAPPISVAFGQHKPKVADRKPFYLRIKKGLLET